MLKIQQEKFSQEPVLKYKMFFTAYLVSTYHRYINNRASIVLLLFFISKIQFLKCKKKFHIFKINNLFLYTYIVSFYSHFTVKISDKHRTKYVASEKVLIHFSIQKVAKIYRSYRTQLLLDEKSNNNEVSDGRVQPYFHARYDELSSLASVSETEDSAVFAAPSTSVPVSEATWPVH